MGESAIGVIRVSGSDAVAIVGPLLRSAIPLAEFPAHTLRRVGIVDAKSGERVDEALCAVMRAPRSYTGEDVVELSCHGSPALLRMVTQWIVAGGARLAAPGEFTRRAFLNGRLDLAQAEAVALMIGARTDRAVALAARALAGGLSERVRTLRDQIVEVIAGLEVVLDFPDERISHDLEAARAAIARLAADVERWRASARHGRIVHDGITVALVGPPNAGKSSLLNALLGRDRAIVSPVPGTTRDIVEGTIGIAGVPVRLLDTAGLDIPRDAIEAEGIRRSRRAMEESDLLLVVLDASIPPDLRALAETASHARVLVRAKSDLPIHPGALAVPDAVEVSTIRASGVEALLERLAREVELRAGAAGDEGGIVASLRQLELIDSLANALAAGEAALADRPLEAALVDLKRALEHAGAILGVDVGDAVLDRIFSTFCLGK
ncbi:MAG: tRNA uridine-5-carboxymethylaminomethyl(34) synthesis GTPase MnmE [Candidatus Rokuibacteriota bacterium]|nr:MAG: tRNA uridine-5-carboxymethylaminomethyl(34) synthesis GTPase MnmE [Candidatus Rokubacteria bacterium]PYO08346.1 MAG: tRNA uridine-5-carboxymethylaminomethyl(34) synthesis GTPase MnmE [Candidatus Rokubacteria bacterium]